jgi:hypothetical protein
LYTILLILLAVAVPSTNKVTLSIPLQPGPEPEEIAVVTFDTDRVSAEELKRWMLLHRHSYFHTPVFGYYPECKPSDVPKLEEDIKKTQQIVDDLDPNKYPPALTDVVQYLKDLQSFWLWQAQQELAFLNSGKLPQTEYNGVDLRMCEVRNSEDKQRMCYEVLHRWHNCANNAMAKKLGSYPVEKWKAFLDSYGIQEKLGSGMNLDE